MEVKVLQDTVCENTSRELGYGTIISDVWDTRRGSYVGLVEGDHVSIPYDEGAIIVEEGYVE